MNLLLLAGTHQEPDKLIYGRNKGFLEIEGRPLVAHVAEAALQARGIDDVYVVGPKAGLEAVFHPLPDRLHIIGQVGGILRNGWKGFTAMFPDSRVTPRDRLLESHYRIRQGRLKPLFKLEIASFLAVECERSEEGILSEVAVKEVIRSRMDRLARIENLPQFYLAKYVLEDLMIGGLLITERSGYTIDSGPLRSYLLEYHRRLTFPIMILGCDTPLIIPETIDHFIGQWEASQADFLFGISIDRDLAPYYQTPEGKEGIVRPYLELAEYPARIANIMILRPNLIGHLKLLDDSYRVRKMKKLTNFFRLLRVLGRLRRGGFRGAALSLEFLLASQATRHDFPRLSRLFHARASRERFEEVLSAGFRTEFRLRVCPFGGVSLDIDEERDYLVLREHFRAWKELQRETARRLDGGVMPAENGESWPFAV